MNKGFKADTFHRLLAYLEDMLQRVGRLVPLIYQMSMSLPHKKIDVLVNLPWNQSIMDDSLLVLRHYAIAITMEGFQKSE